MSAVPDFTVDDIIRNIDTVRDYVKDLNWQDALDLLDQVIYVCSEYPDPFIAVEAVKKMEYSAKFIWEGYHDSQIVKRRGRASHLQEKLRDSAVDSLTDLNLYLDLIADPRLNSSSRVRSDSAGYSHRPVMSALSKSLKADIDRVVDLVERGDYSEAANLMGDCRDKYSAGKNASSEVISLMEELTGYMYQASDYERSEQYGYAQEEAWSILDIIKDDLLPMLKAKESAKPGKSKASAFKLDTSDLDTRYPALMDELEAIGYDEDTYPYVLSDVRSIFEDIADIFRSIIMSLCIHAENLFSDLGPDSLEYKAVLRQLRAPAESILDAFRPTMSDASIYGRLVDCLEELTATGTLGSEPALARFVNSLESGCAWPAFSIRTGMSYDEFEGSFGITFRFCDKFGSVLRSLAK